MSPHLLFITTHNLATNPRVYKEVRLALQQGYEVTLICFEFDHWSKTMDEQLLQTISAAKIIQIPAGRKPLLPWLKSVVTEKLFRWLGKGLKLPVSWQAGAVSRRNQLLIKAIQKVPSADWVIGHNPGALYATWYAAQQLGAKAGFDVEDYHPGEGEEGYLSQVTLQLMERMLPKMNYCSFASPLIMQETALTIQPTPQWFSVLNYFSKTEFYQSAVIKDKIKLVWFSQNINVGRGLELILPQIKQLAERVELHLIGNMHPQFQQTYLKDAVNVFVHPPMAQKDLHLNLQNFDAGLALEPCKDRNNELAISNKMLAYMQAGLWVIASNTPAQESFLSDFPAHGSVFNLDPLPNNIFENLILQIDQIRNNRTNRFEQFQHLCWETESKRLLQQWQQ